MPKTTIPLRLTAGIPFSLEYENAMHEGARKLGFGWNHVWGCLSNDTVDKDMRRHNKKVAKALSKKDKNWLKTFDTEVDRLIIVHRKADSILSRNNFFWEHRITPPVGEVDQVYYREMDKSSILEVNIINGDHMISKKLILYQQFHLNMADSTVTLIKQPVINFSPAPHYTPLSIYSSN